MARPRRALQWWLAVLSAVAPSVAGAQSGPDVSIRLERLGSEHGLSHNTVHAILQDRTGFLWFGTQDGLDRFDGLTFRAARHSAGDPTSLSSNWITALIEDRRGALWIGTRAGLNRRRADGRFDRIRLAPDEGAAWPEVVSLAEDRDGRILVGTRSGLLRVQPATSPATIDRGPSDAAQVLAGRSVHAVKVDGTGAIWVLDEDPDHRFSLTHETPAGFRRTATPPAFALALDAPDFPRPAQPVTAIRRDDRGRVWVGTYTGLYLQPAASRRLEPVDTGQVRAGALAGEITTFFEDRAGAMWIGTFGGVLRHDPYRKLFNQFAHAPGDPASLSSDAVSSVVEDRTGALWIGTYGGGLNWRERGSVKLRRWTAGADGRSTCGDFVWDLAPALPPRTGVWMTTTTRVCHVTLLGAEPHDVVPECRNALAILEAPAGVLWLGTHTGVCRVDVGTSRSVQVLSAAGMEMAAVDTLHQDSRGRVWLGSAGSGLTTLAVYDPASGAATAYREAGRAGIWDIASAGGDAVWLATSTGLSHFDPVARRSRAVATPGDGGLFYSVLVDEAGLVWAGTNKGIVRFDPAGGATRRFLPVDGTGNVEFNRHAAARLLDGSLAFGGMHGVTYFRPADLVHNPHPPPVAITAARVVGRRGEADRLLPDGSVALGPGDVAVTFEFAALGFTAALQNALAYRLEGWDRDWLDAGHARSVRYTNLPPASYTFRVRAANNDGVWNREGAAVTVVVAPAFWQSWWFRLAVALLAAAAILVWHRARLARALEVERLRLRIAADLHDELGSDLSGIALAASLLGRDEALSERSRDRLARVAAAVARVTEGLRDIVWHVNPEHDTLPALEARLRGVAAAILGDLAHDVRTSGVTRPVSMDVRRHLVLIVKELLANIVRHARATRVAIRVAWAAGALRLSVADDGRGFDEANGERGAGLANIERRARAIGGSVVTETGTERGTRTIVEVPLGR